MIIGGTCQSKSELACFLLYVSFFPDYETGKRDDDQIAGKWARFSYQEQSVDFEVLNCIQKCGHLKFRKVDDLITPVRGRMTNDD